MEPVAFGMIEATTPVKNCFVLESVVFTRFGSTDLSTPIGTTTNCQYNAGLCKINTEHGNVRFLWTLDIRHNCQYIKAEKQQGNYANNIFLNDNKEFALTFSQQKIFQNCNITLLISDQGFAIPLFEFKIANITLNSRFRRNIKHWSRDEGHAKEHDGVVYST